MFEYFINFLAIAVGSVAERVGARFSDGPALSIQLSPRTPRCCALGMRRFTALSLLGGFEPAANSTKGKTVSQKAPRKMATSLRVQASRSKDTIYFPGNRE